MRSAVPNHLPSRLAISLWDFSWYTRAGAGDPFADVHRAFDEAVDRGYNTVRICAAPLLLFGGLGIGESIEISGFGTSAGGELIGSGTRWYDVRGGYRIELHVSFLTLLEAARDHGCVVILSSWEYQQSSAFTAADTWWRALEAIPFDERLLRLAGAWSDLLDAVDARGLTATIAFVELHNELDFSRVPTSSVAVNTAIHDLKRRHPEILVTASYGKPPHLDMASIPESVEVGQFHVYAYGVLDALQEATALRGPESPDFPNPALRALLRDAAQPWPTLPRPAAWRFDATVITEQMLYGYDQIDPVAWDRWLYENYALYSHGMHREIESRVDAFSAWSRRTGVPFVVGEGWVGYTPLHANFEEGPVGVGLAEHGIRRALEAGAWGVVPSSNAAPHHPMWADVEWQRRMNAIVLSD